MEEVPKVFLDNNSKVFSQEKKSLFWSSLNCTGIRTDIRFYEDPFILKIERDFNLFLEGREQTKQVIPNLIHFIWLGSSIPNGVQIFIDSCKNLHPQFSFKIWSEEEVEKYAWSFQRSEFAYTQAKTYAEKADILRYDVLFQFGGIYFDVDVICLKSFEGILKSGATFFAGLLANVVVKKYHKPLFLGNAVMGAVKGSLVMKYCLENLKTEEEDPFKHLPIRTGPGLLSDACSQFLFSDKEKILVLPCSFFYPYPDLKRGLKIMDIMQLIRQESHCIHLWNQSWNLPLGKEPIPKKRKNSFFWTCMNCTGAETDYNFFVNPVIQKVEEVFEEFQDKDSLEEIQIPALIHFIWLGPSLPLKMHEIVDSWKSHHPEYEIRIWGDKEAKNFSWSSKRLKNLFESAKTYAEKSDIFRYDILYQYGGIYSDTDVCCVKSFTKLLSSGATFIAGLESNRVIQGFGHPLYLGNAIIAVSRGSSIMKHCLESLKSDEEDRGIHLPFRTGPGHLSNACKKYLFTREEKILILPCSFFYPLPHSKRHVEKKKAMELLRQESYCIHFWESSWV